MFSRFLFWPWFAGLTLLAIGLFAVRRELAAARGLDKLVVLGRVFFAAPLAVFGAEHLAGAQFIVNIVPAWMPARLFWVYFVGLALLAAALSIVLMRYVRWSASLLALMFFLFVVMIHVPNVAANPGGRILWAVALRDLAFGGGALALAAAQTKEWRRHGSNRPIAIGRLLIAIPVLFFAVEHFLHPEFVPGVPLAKLTPAWFPLRLSWGYVTGAVLAVAGLALLLNKQSRTAATLLGLVVTLLVLFLYLPILAAAQPPALMEGLNYVADTLLFAGTVLLLAAATPPAAAGSYNAARPAPK